MSVRKITVGPNGVSILPDAPKKKKKGTVKFGKIQRVDPEKEKQRRRDARTRKQMTHT